MDDETLAFVRQLFDLAREGGAQEHAGVPVDLTDDKGDTLLLLAAYAPSPATVRALLERGAHPSGSSEAAEALLAASADPRCGSPDAVATAHFFQLPDMVRLLTRSDA